MGKPRSLFLSLQNGNEKKSIMFQARAYAADPNHKFDMKLEGQTLCYSSNIFRNT